MKQIINKLLVWTISACFMFTLSACGNQQPTIEIVENEGTQDVYISFFSPSSLNDSDVGKYWSDHFVKEYNKPIYINYEGATYYADAGLSYRELLEKRLESSMPDDLYIINAEDVIDFEHKGYWMDLSELAFVNNLSEAALYQSTYNNKVFSVPLKFTGFGFFWNVDMLSEHGLEVPNNLEEFLHVCEVLKAAGITPYGGNKGFALTVPIMCVGLNDLYKSSDLEEKINDLNQGKTSISSYLRKGYELLEMMIDKGYMDTEVSLQTAPGEDFEQFKNGEFAFMCTSLGEYYENTPEKLGFDVEMTGLPVIEEGFISVYGADSRLCVNPESKQLDTVLEFVEMVGSNEALNLSASLSHTMASTKDSSLADFEHAQRLVDCLSQPGQIPNQDFSLHFNTWENVRNIARELCAGISVDEACEKIDALQISELNLYTK